MRKFTTLSKNILLSIISLVLFIAIAEIFTHLFWNVEKNDSKPNVGVVLEEENRNFTYKGVEYKTNSYGIRNKELGLSSPKGMPSV